MAKEKEDVIELGEKEKLTEILSECYEAAELESKKDDISDLIATIGESDSKVIIELANTKHACRGAAITLAIYKILHPEQDIRSHKAEYDNGFSARGVDHNVTVPFLIQKGLPYNVDTHWLSQTLSYSQPYTPDVILKTVPKKAGSDFIITANLIQDADSTERVKKITTLILEKMIEERNKGNIPLTKPKNLSIDQIMEILHKQFSASYEKNAPRLPQIAVYAIYKCLMNDVDRYSGFELKPLERMKTANRKSGTVGDIDLWENGRPIEAVEIKYEIAVGISHVSEAIQKVQTESVERYFILSTAKPDFDEWDDVQNLISDFRKSNGCEIIVNGVYETIKYYLRLLKSTNEFINAYTDLLAVDEDINYEHKVAWNAICAERK
ncbi:hypothetical protein [Roseburia inulinivorans]